MQIIIHYNEIALKKGNRDYFEKKLINNIKDRVEKEFPGKLKGVKRFPGRFLVDLENGLKKERVGSIFQNIFGVANFSFVVSVKQDVENFKKECWKLIKDKTQKKHVL